MGEKTEDPKLSKCWRVKTPNTWEEKKGGNLKFLRRKKGNLSSW